MLKKVNLLEKVNSLTELYLYEKTARMNGNVLSVVQVENH